MDGEWGSDHWKLNTTHHYQFTTIIFVPNELMGLYQNNALEFHGIFAWKLDEAC